MARVLKSVAFLVAGGALLATGGCAITDLLSQLLPAITPVTGG